jgi:hypothetical protein
MLVQVAGGHLQCSGGRLYGQLQGPEGLVFCARYCLCRGSVPMTGVNKSG